MKNLTVKGRELLTSQESIDLDNLIEHYRDKILWRTKGEFSLVILIRARNKNPENKEKRKLYGVDLKVTGESHTFESIAEDWDFKKTVRMAFEKIQLEIEHAYHSSEQRNSEKK